MSKSTTSLTASIFWRQAWHYKLYVLGILLLVPVVVLFEQYLNTAILANVLNKLAHSQSLTGSIWQSFGREVILYTLFMLVGTVGWRVIDVFMWRLEANVQRDLARRIYAHLLAQSANFHANHFSGSLVSHTNKFMGAYIRVADTTIFQVLQMLSGLIFTIIILAPRVPLYVVALVILSLLYMISGVFVTRKVRHLSSVQANSESKQTGYLADSVTNIMAIKSFAGSKYEHKKFAHFTDVTKNDTLNIMRASQKQMFYFSSLNRVILVVSLLMAIIGVTVFNANIGTVFLVFSYTGSLVNQLWDFCNNSLRSYNRGFGDASDMTKILQIEPEVRDPINPEVSNFGEGGIAFNDVTFAHDGAGDSIFKKLSLDIKPGEKIGLVGHSGSGKTTFVRLLLRFSDIDEGAILIDGQNIAKVTQDDLHKSIAYVPQEPVMFHRSLEDNIRYGDFKASKEAVLAAAKNSHAAEFIADLPDGYETLVGERGVKLSGGQRQRIAIARAILKNAPVLVLDEATSALDSESEVLIQDALSRLMEGRTTIVIAHRLSTIQKMDRIVVLEEGKIIEEGTHKELLAQNGTYAKLWAHQSGGFIEE